MATVYILFSKTIDKYYIGSCIDISERMKEHNSKKFKSSYTSKVSDWIVVFQIDDLEYSQARDIETHIKRMKSRKYIKNLCKYPDISNKLKLKYI